MTADEALRYAQGAARMRQLRVRYGGHVTKRQGERNVQIADMRQAILTATTAAASDDATGRWVVSGGTDLDGEPLTVVVCIAGNEVHVVTPF